MIELQHGEWDEVEELVRQAGTYVRPSEELRPRVLEIARAESRERRAGRRIWQAALAVAVWGAICTATGGRFDAGGPFSGVLGMHADSLQASARQADAPPAEGCWTGWSMVESFTSLRRKQADLLDLKR